MQTHNEATRKVVCSDKVEIISTIGRPTLAFQTGLTPLVFQKQREPKKRVAGETRFPSEYVTFPLPDRRSGHVLCRQPFVSKRFMMWESRGCSFDQKQISLCPLPPQSCVGPIPGGSEGKKERARACARTFLSPKVSIQSDKEEHLAFGWTKEVEVLRLQTTTPLTSQDQPYEGRYTIQGDITELNTGNAQKEPRRQPSTVRRTLQPLFAA